MTLGDHFVYQGKAWRAESAPFPAGGSIGEAVLAKRLWWKSTSSDETRPADCAYSYGETVPIPTAGTSPMSWAAFDPDDPEGDDFGLFDREREAAQEDDPT